MKKEYDFSKMVAKKNPYIEKRGQMKEKLKSTAKKFETMASELEKAIRHAEIAATHFRSKEVPRGCAHAIAVQGHMLAANELMNEFLMAHRKQAKANG